jgi:hypothetical protein
MFEYIDKHVDGSRFRHYGDDDGKDGQWCGMALSVSGVHEENWQMMKDFIHRESRRNEGDNG